MIVISQFQLFFNLNPMKMKHVNKLFVVVLLLVGSASVNAQSTAQATATATIVTPISIAKITDMNFGNLAVDAVTGGSVVLAPSATPTRNPFDGVSLPSTAGTVSAARFTVTGNAGYTYAITLPGNVVLNHSGAFESMMADSFTSTPSGTGTLTGGTEDILVGATLWVSAGQLDGVYTSADFDVTVNYN
jgi:hypothetical protein